MITGSTGKENWVFGAVILALLVAFLFTSPALAQGKRHWAWESAQALAEIGVGGDTLRQALAADACKELDTPISPLEWRICVRQALMVKLGTNLVFDQDKEYWLEAYTAPQHEGPRSVLSRGYAVAGLMKIGNVFGFIPGGWQGPLVHLPQFNDWRQVEEQGLSGPWEIMLAAGIVHGYPDGTLRPEVPLTRAEAFCLLKAWLDVYKNTPRMSSVVSSHGRERPSAAS